MSKMKVYTVFLCFLHMCVYGMQVVIRFRSSDSKANTRQYDTDSMIFRVSEHLQAEVNKHVNRKNAENEKDREPDITLDCEATTFEITAAFLEGDVPKVHIKARDVADVLRLANSLGIADRRIRLYTQLAKATIVDEELMKEIHKYKDVQGINLFMLQLLRDFAGVVGKTDKDGIDVRVSDNRATLCLQQEDTEGYCGSLESICEVDRIKICSGAINKLKSSERILLGLLSSFACVANVCELEIECMHGSIDTSMMMCVGRMESLEVLRICMNNHNKKLRGLKHLKELENLVELDISGCVFECTDNCSVSVLECSGRIHARKSGLSEIAGLKRIKKLNIRNCKITPGNLRCLGELKTLEELDVSRNSLNRKDALFIRGMKKLTSLDLSYCELEPGNVKLLQEMRCLKELRVANNELSEEDLCAVGKMESLLSLDLRDCLLGPGCLVHLRDLACLEEILVSNNELDKSDLVVIGRMKSLRALTMCDCKLMEQDGLESLVNLRSLEQLYISRTRLGLDEVQTIGKIPSLKVLEVCCCGLQPESLTPLRSLGNLQALKVSLNILSKEDVSVIGNMAELTVLSLRECSLPEGSLVCIKNLRKIQSLDVSSNRLSQSDMIAISNMSSITRLEMCMGSVYVGSLKHLKDMENLRYLNLYRNKLCGDDIIAIACMKNLIELNISSCKVELERLGYICMSKSLKSLRVSNVIMVDKDYATLETFSRNVYVNK
eukprot:jgi/Antlo1/805/213